MSKIAELVIIPSAGVSHLRPTVQLAKLILQKTQRISISLYIIYQPHHALKVEAYLNSQSHDNPYPTRLTFLPFPILAHSPDPSPLSFVSALHTHTPLIKQALHDRVKAGSPKPAAFVLDMFCAALVDVADDLDIPSYVFSTSGANFFNLMFYAQSLADDHGVDYLVKEFSDPGFSRLVPGFNNPVTSHVIPSVLQFHGPWFDTLLELTRKVRKTKGILVNTYEELELLGIQELSKGSDDKKVRGVYPVGPIVELVGHGYDNNGESIMEWLNDQPESSVVFLCFGSMGCFDEEQVKEIANGLDKSGHRFLWALRRPHPLGKPGPPSDSETFLEALPVGFIERTTNRGKIIAFTPQVAVLAHPAVGGFVSHCGWNSTLESIWFGVPMATWPMYAEQQLTAFGLVKELELAVEIRMNYKLNLWLQKGNILVTAEEIQKGVENLMNMDKNMKGRVKRMSDEGRQALKEAGSSDKGLAHFIKDVLKSYK